MYLLLCPNNGWSLDGYVINSSWYFSYVPVLRFIPFSALCTFKDIAHSLNRNGELLILKFGIDGNYHLFLFNLIAEVGQVNTNFVVVTSCRNSSRVFRDSVPIEIVAKGYMAIITCHFYQFIAGTEIYIESNMYSIIVDITLHFRQ